MVSFTPGNEIEKFVYELPSFWGYHNRLPVAILFVICLNYRFGYSYMGCKGTLYISLPSNVNFRVLVFLSEFEVQNMFNLSNSVDR